VETGLSNTIKADKGFDAKAIGKFSEGPSRLTIT